VKNLKEKAECWPLEGKPLFMQVGLNWRKLQSA
jgi:hypothetical protein